jgi:ketosteroid isomerase-like protein
LNRALDENFETEKRKDLKMNTVKLLSRRWIGWGVLLTFLGLACVVSAEETPRKKEEAMSDLDNLKAAVGRWIVAYNSRNLDAIAAGTHEGVTFFNTVSPFALDGKAALRQLFQGQFTNFESVIVTPINLQYRAMGMSGVAWGHVAIAIKPKDGPLRTIFSRISLALTKEDNKWLIVSIHQSLLPSGN